VTPGFVDVHTHLRQPGKEEAETVETGSRAGVLGGYTTLLAMPNTTPAIDSAGVVREVLALGAEALCRVEVSAAITVGRKGEGLSPMAELAALGVRLFTDDGSGVQDGRLMRRALEYARPLGVVLAQHCEDEALAAGGVMHEGEWSSMMGVPGVPAEAEELMVMRDIALARLTGGRVHFQHLSTAGSVAMVRAAKAAGLPVTAEATPHHLALTAEACQGFDPVFRVNPPLRTQADVDAVAEGVRDGTIDAIATDHAPHDQEAKEQPFDQAPPGMLGLETAAAVVLTQLQLAPERLVDVLVHGPRRVLGLPPTGVAVGEPADLAVLDPSEVWVVDRDRLASRSRNTPYHGRRLTGRVRHTVCRGEAVVVGGEAQRRAAGPTRCSSWPTARCSRARPSAPRRPAASPRARPCSTPRSPATRRSPPTPPTRARSCASLTRTSATTGPTPTTWRPAGRPCAASSSESCRGARRRGGPPSRSPTSWSAPACPASRASTPGGSRATSGTRAPCRAPSAPPTRPP
jgi:dihydroorotase